MDKESKARLKKLVINICILLAVGLAYYLFVTFTGLAIPCVIHKITGYYCPGCGITRMFVALFSLDLALAAQNNLLIMVIALPALIFAVYRAGLYVRGIKKGYNKIEMTGILIVALLTVAFWVLRNIPEFSFLAPVS